MSNKLYCPVCDKEVNYKIEKRFIHYNENGLSFDYYENVAICCECGEELYSDELQALNQKIFEDAFKKNNDIITIEEIKEILDKYKISKRELPHVLELGELTITRYLDGYVPTKKISDLLKKVLNCPEEYKKYLDKNKDKLSHNVYMKTSNKLDSILGIGQYDEKLEECAEYIICKNLETSNLVLNKILFYFDVFYRLFNSKKIFEAQVKAWEHGPVYGRIYYEYKKFGSDPITKEEIGIHLSKNEKDLLDEIIKCFGLYSGNVLSYFTHHSGPWKISKEKGDERIDSSLIDEFANELKVKYNINNISDISNYSESMFNEYKNYINH